MFLINSFSISSGSVSIYVYMCVCVCVYMYVCMSVWHRNERKEEQDRGHFPWSTLPAAAIAVAAAAESLLTRHTGSGHSLLIERERRPSMMRKCLFSKEWVLPSPQEPATTGPTEPTRGGSGQQDDDERRQVHMGKWTHTNIRTDTHTHTHETHTCNTVSYRDIYVLARL